MVFPVFYFARKPVDLGLAVRDFLLQVV
jgi:hypothetical protein